jgi:hypothetical protein
MSARPPRSRPDAGSGLVRQAEPILVGGDSSAESLAAPQAFTHAPAPVPVSAGTLKRIRRDLLMAARQLAAARALVAEREAEWAQARAGAESAGLPADMRDRMVTAAWTDAGMDLPVDA